MLEVLVCEGVGVGVRGFGACSGDDRMQNY